MEALSSVSASALFNNKKTETVHYQTLPFKSWSHLVNICEYYYIVYYNCMSRGLHLRILPYGFESVTDLLPQCSKSKQMIPRFLISKGLQAGNLYMCYFYKCMLCHEGWLGVPRPKTTDFLRGSQKGTMSRVLGGDPRAQLVMKTKKCMTAKGLRTESSLKPFEVSRTLTECCESYTCM